MTIAALKALLETLSDTTRLSVVVQEYQRRNGHASAAHFPLDTVNVHNGELFFIVTIDVAAAEMQAMQAQIQTESYDDVDNL